MKRIQYDKYGGPELMRLADFELPMPCKGQVAVKVQYAAINPIDWKLRNGQMKIVTGNSFPRAMGMDLSGTVISVGAGVTRFKPGDAVFGLARFKECGALRQAVVTNEAFLARKPDNVSFEDAVLRNDSIPGSKALSYCGCGLIWRCIGSVVSSRGGSMRPPERHWRFCRAGLSGDRHW